MFASQKSQLVSLPSSAVSQSHQAPALHLQPSSPGGLRSIDIPADLSSSAAAAAAMTQAAQTGGGPNALSIAPPNSVVRRDSQGGGAGSAQNSPYPTTAAQQAQAQAQSLAQAQAALAAAQKQGPSVSRDDFDDLDVRALLQKHETIVQKHEELREFPLLHSISLYFVVLLNIYFIFFVTTIRTP
jgi:hypothetical protein